MNNEWTNYERWNNAALGGYLSGRSGHHTEHTDKSTQLQQNKNKKKGRKRILLDFYRSFGAVVYYFSTMFARAGNIRFICSYKLPLPVSVRRANLAEGSMDTAIRPSSMVNSQYNFMTKWAFISLSQQTANWPAIKAHAHTVNSVRFGLFLFVLCTRQ